MGKDQLKCERKGCREYQRKSENMEVKKDDMTIFPSKADGKKSEDEMGEIFLS